jgi:hypothetical protein
MSRCHIPSNLSPFWLGAFVAAALHLAPYWAVADTVTNSPAEAPPTVAPPATNHETPAVVTVPVPSPALAPATPKVLNLELTILRFKPATNQPFYQDYKLFGPISTIVSTLLTAGRSVDVLYHGTRELVVEPKSTAKFSATETRPIILIGKQGTSPPAIVYGLTMQVEVRPAGKDSFILAWDGSLNWSPDLIDRRAPTGPDAAQILDKAATAAKSMSAMAGKSQAATIGLAVADLFKEDPANNSAIYELPVLKTVALGGSRICHNYDTVINATTAEAGAKETQIIFFILNPVLE